MKMNRSSFNRLLAKMKRKDKKGNDAFTELYKFFFPKIVIHIWNYYRNKNLGEDVAQEFFTKLLTLKIEKEIEYPVAWVYKICNNIANELILNDRRYKAAYLNRITEDSDEAYERAACLEQLKELDKLDRETKNIILMYAYEGYSLKDIAKEMRLNYNTVRQKYSRGIKKVNKI